MAANLQSIVAESLRAAALEADAGGGGNSSGDGGETGGGGSVTPIENAWIELATGQSRVVDSFCRMDRCFLVTERYPIGARVAPGLTPRNVDILARSLIARLQKNVAHELEITASAVAFAASRCLRAMGLDCTASTAPTLLVAAVLAHRNGTGLPARVAYFKQEGREHSVYSISRPEPSDGALSVAERDIVRLIIERRSNREIARLRATSTRTVANQLSRILAKLDVDGRLGVVQRLVAASPSSNAMMPRWA